MYSSLSSRSRSVTNLLNLSKTILSFSFSDFVGWEVFKSDALQKLTSAVWRTRGYGDFWSHLLVAEGAIDIAAEPSLALWDMAALCIIVKEAGGRFSDFSGVEGPNGANAVTTNGLLHEEVLGIFAKR
jgi:histidinol-phosphatase